MAQTGEPWQGVESKLEALSLEDQEAVPQDSGAVPTSDMSSNTPLSEDVKFGAVHSELERAAQEVDHALSDALCHPKNRHMVLHLEAEVERFVQDDAASTHVFMHDMTSYERLLAHRVAQHWGLETSIVNHGPDQGCVMAIKGLDAGKVQIKLSDVSVTLVHLSEPAAPGPPRLLVRRRGERSSSLRPPPSDSGGGGYGPPPGPAHHSHLERENLYERTRARIFADSSGGLPVPPPPPSWAGPHAAAGWVALPPGPPGAASPVGPRAGAYALAHASAPGTPTYGAVPPFFPPPRMGSAPAPPSLALPGGAPSARKAVLRNRREDLADPDFRRDASRACAGRDGFGAEYAPQGPGLPLFGPGGVPLAALHAAQEYAELAPGGGGAEGAALHLAAHHAPGGMMGSGPHPMLLGAGAGALYAGDHAAALAGAYPGAGGGYGAALYKPSGGGAPGEGYGPAPLPGPGAYAHPSLPGGQTAYVYAAASPGGAMLAPSPMLGPQLVWGGQGWSALPGAAYAQQGYVQVHPYGFVPVRGAGGGAEGLMPYVVGAYAPSGMGLGGPGAVGGGHPLQQHAPPARRGAGNGRSRGGVMRERPAASRAGSQTGRAVVEEEAAKMFGPEGSDQSSSAPAGSAGATLELSKPGSGRDSCDDGGEEAGGAGKEAEEGGKAGEGERRDQPGSPGGGGGASVETPATPQRELADDLAEISC